MLNDGSHVLRFGELSSKHSRMYLEAQIRHGLTIRSHVSSVGTLAHIRMLNDGTHVLRYWDGAEVVRTASRSTVTCRRELKQHREDPGSDFSISHSHLS